MPQDRWPCKLTRDADVLLEGMAEAPESRTTAAVTGLRVGVGVEGSPDPTASDAYDLCRVITG